MNTDILLTRHMGSTTEYHMITRYAAWKLAPTLAGRVKVDGLVVRQDQAAQPEPLDPPTWPDAYARMARVYSEFHRFLANVIQHPGPYYPVDAWRAERAALSLDAIGFSGDLEKNKREPAGYYERLRVISALRTVLLFVSRRLEEAAAQLE